MAPPQVGHDGLPELAGGASAARQAEVQEVQQMHSCQGVRQQGDGGDEVLPGAKPSGAPDRGVGRDARLQPWILP